MSSHSSPSLFTNPLGGISLLKNALSRSISPENFTGEKGRGGAAFDGTGKLCARELGVGWKVSPSVLIEPQQTFVLADITGAG